MDDQGITNLNASARVLQRTITQKLLPLINPEQLSKLCNNKNDSNNDLINKQWNDILNQFSVVAKQLEQLSADVQPEYQMSSVVPKNPGVGDIIGSSVNNQLSLLPSLLSTMIPPEDEPYCVTKPDNDYSLANIINNNNPTDNNSSISVDIAISDKELLQAIEDHNKEIIRLLDDVIPTQLEQLKDKKNDSNKISNSNQITSSSSDKVSGSKRKFQNQ